MIDWESSTTVQPYRGTNQDIERLASSLREAVQKQSGEEFRGRRLLDKIVDLTGGAVETVDDPSRQEVDGGSLVIRGESDYTVYLSPYTTPLRDNFTVAHELGHFFLHLAFDGDVFRLCGFFGVYRVAVETRGESLSCPVE